ncbi:MAG: MgtC/SapB family protein [Coprobacillaceae bacterium]
MIDIFDIELFFRIIIAGICGGLIGQERKNRSKDAGTRTHFIVALASCLLMIISKYGFEDLSYNQDPSRIAAQVVSGVSFLGAGLILVKDTNVFGLTTAAGIWATSGVGMAIGSGLYALGIISSIIIITIQLVTHKDQTHTKEIDTPIEIILIQEENNIALLNEYLRKQSIKLMHVKISKRENDTIKIRANISTPDDYEIESMLELLESIPSIQSISI